MPDTTPTKEEEEEAALQLQAQAAQAALAAQVKETLHCPWHDPMDAEKPCPFITRSEVVLAMHERAKHTRIKTIKMRSTRRMPRSPKDGDQVPSVHQERDPQRVQVQDDRIRPVQ